MTVPFRQAASIFGRTQRAMGSSMSAFRIDLELNHV